MPLQRLVLSGNRLAGPCPEESRGRWAEQTCTVRAYGNFNARMVPTLHNRT